MVVPKKKASEILREARVLIEDWTFEFICHAVDQVVAGKKAKRRVKKHIGDLLYPSTTLEGWLETHYPRPSKIPYCRSFDRMRITRLAWIDDMIRYFERKGD